MNTAYRLRDHSVFRVDQVLTIFIWNKNKKLDQIILTLCFLFLKLIFDF